MLIPFGVILMWLDGNVLGQALLYVALMPIGLIYAMGQRDMESDDPAKGDSKQVGGTPATQLAKS